MAVVGSVSPSHYDSFHDSEPPHWRLSLRGPLVASARPRSFSALQEVDLASELDGLHVEGLEALARFKGIDAVTDPRLPARPSSQRPESASVQSVSDRAHSDDAGINRTEDGDTVHGPFQKWMRSLRRKAQRTSMLNDPEKSPWSYLYHPDEHDTATTVAKSRNSVHKNSSSGSSFGFVSAVRSASVSLASFSVVTRPRRHTARSHCRSRTDRSSRASFTGPRISEDTCTGDRPVFVDAATTERAFQRRRILEELIQTEESYIGDVRFLIHVYITILASIPTLPTGLRSSINRNLNDIVSLHEEILGDLHRIVPHSEYTQPDLTLSSHKSSRHTRHPSRAHQRWSSLDAVPEKYQGHTWLQNMPGIVLDPQVGAEVAKIFRKKMSRFFIYKEYGAKYELMIKDVASAHRTMPDWDMYQRGLETLASTLGSSKGNENQARKSLTIGDLLVKPIQRVCKYPLLFAELLKYTPVSDCPNSHMEVDNALTRLREATAEINRATNDIQIKAALEKTWLLQDRLVFPRRKLDAASKNRVRSFGLVRLCGVLHVCWQGSDGIQGQYFIALLYHDVMCLAFAGRVEPIYTITACINLSGAKVEDADNGRGLQCHTAPFSWKLVFECDHQLYEVLMTACSSKEGSEWRERLSGFALGAQETRDPELFSTLDLSMKSLGTVFGKPGTMARRMSIHRATTVGPKSPLLKVIVKNTTAARDGSNTSTGPTTVQRSQSLLTTNSRLPVLAPSRADRTRLEMLLNDVWSRDILPYPGLTTRSRSEHLVRSSASSVMRKLSVVGIANSFNKRSGSFGQKGKLTEDGCTSGCAQHGEGHGDNDSIVPSVSDWDGHGEDGADASQSMASVAPEFKDEADEQERPKRLRTVDRPNSIRRAATPSFELTEITGVVRRLEPSRSMTESERCQGNRRTKVSPVLRNASMNSLRLTASSVSGKSRQCSLEKENRCQSPQVKSQGSGRWQMPGSTKSDGKVQGFRSLFR